MRETSSDYPAGQSGKLNACLLMSAVAGALGGLLFGFDTAVISGGTEALRKVFVLTDVSMGFTVSIALIGTVFGALLAGIPGERYGARECLKVLGVFFFVSSAGCALAWTWPVLLAARFLGGLAIGGVSVLAPVYIAEISPARWRGRLVGLFQCSIVTGILVAYLSNSLIDLANLGDLDWRVKLGSGAVPAILFFSLLFGIPRSPRWLVKKGQVAEARGVLTDTGEENIEQELQDIQASLEADEGMTGTPLFTKKHLFPIYLAVSIAMFNQLSGINGLLYYLNDIFVQAGFSKSSGDLQTIVIGGTNLLFTMLAMTIIDKVGRRLLLLVGSIGTAFCLSGVAWVFFTNQHQNFLIWLLVGYIAFFAFSQGAVIWVYISEVFPNSIRAKGQALGCFTHWFMCAVVSFSFPILAKTSGGYPFCFFAVMMVIQFFVVFFTYPETKGATLEDIQKKLTTH
jgi:MFS transporter, SP family, arabinose:H+ symporter